MSNWYNVSFNSANGHSEEWLILAENDEQLKVWCEKEKYHYGLESYHYVRSYNGGESFSLKAGINVKSIIGF